jgi:hypothetical protein
VRKYEKNGKDMKELGREIRSLAIRLGIYKFLMFRDSLVLF